MNIEDIRALYEYNCWANDRILNAAESLSPELFASAALSYCKLRETLVHILSAERRWRLRWQGVPDAQHLRAEDFSTLATLRARWREEIHQMRGYLATLSDADVSSIVTYSRPKGQSMTNTYWHTMLHMVNHGTQHRAELAMLLTELGHSPGNIDLLVFVSEP